ncbi:GyrI-like domain-containing protein [Paenibacillus athensensis]|uniref:GyrI-like small molecule binding domain-containing protein n=1 Tax=Paenibacillus athensensis TaxID=1967502 RepID=A0A4Y8Q8K7_9BACL|nr:GyrI-like domain-containing protein [Paenibacillus athensensis]MCD1260346.1 GyrI-like domain-containing protein [Paenibacillus athensensis]
MTQIDYKKHFKSLYLPKTSPEIVEVPRMPFITVSGSGNPNGEAFAAAVEALYSLTYAVKMSYKSNDVPAGYYAYTVFPLEGVWDLIDRTRPATDKDNLKYTLMIRQPDFLNDALFARFLEQTTKKKQNSFLAHARFEYVEEGRCCQMLHLGSFDDEPQSFARMEAFCTETGYTRPSKIHREIYLSDPRKTKVEKLRTVLRFGVTRDAND